ncbi:MAG: BTAD domain-containing putative transcriptional regulator [Clostridia bacterium]
MENKSVQINLFGGFEIIADGNIALEQLRQAKKTSQFLQYLILKRDRPVPHEELLDMLWSQKESMNPATALRTLLHRYRTLVEQSGLTVLDNSVLTTRGAYQWNPRLKCEIDVYAFERLFQEACTPGMCNEDRMMRYQKMMLLYTGSLLGSVCNETWAVSKNVYYHDLYMEGVFTLIELLKVDQQQDAIVTVCRRAMEVDLFDERLHLELMMALVKTGKKREAFSQYYFTTDLYAKQTDAQPSEEIRSVYHMIVQADQEMEADIEKVRGSLEKEDSGVGAFVCQYEIFNEIYQLQRRILERTNGTMFLALLSLSLKGTDECMQDQFMLERFMKQLLMAAQQNLRRGDTISRYTATQYVVLLPTATYETGKLVIDRVKKAFYADDTKPNVMFNFRLCPLCVGKYSNEATKKK